MVVHSSEEPVLLVEQGEFMNAAPQLGNPLQGIARSRPLFPIAAVAPNAALMRGDRFASVATGLGVHARRVFG